MRRKWNQGLRSAQEKTEDMIWKCTGKNTKKKKKEKEKSEESEQGTEHVLEEPYVKMMYHTESISIMNSIGKVQ